MKPILFTGGCGFIGTNLVHYLSRQGLRTRVLDLKPAPISPISPDGFSDDVEIVAGDIRDQRLCRQAMEDVGAVVHLAAESSIPPSVEDPETNFSVNVEGTLNLLLAAKDAGVKRFVLASSGAVLGRHVPPADERTPALPASPYGASKLAAEAYCLAFGDTYGMSSVALRFANIYGPGSSHKRSVVAEFCKRALRGEPLVLFGDGKQTRDFLFVNDLMTVIHNCLGKTDATGVFQLGSGVGTSVLDVAEMIQETVTREGRSALRLDFQPARPFEVRDSYYRIDKARETLGFTSATDVREGIRQTWAWFVKHATGHEVAVGSSE
jgi:UDP-glucose 4-epimerase